MKKLIDRFSGLVKGSITGFDRIVFKGFILPLMSAKQVMQFCTAQGVLNKVNAFLAASTENLLKMAA